MRFHRHRIRARLLPVSILVLVLVGCTAGKPGPRPVELKGVTDLVQDGRLYVSGALTDDGLKALKARGVQTIIDVRLDDQVSPEYPAAVRNMGLTYIRLPMQSDRLTEQEAARFLDVMKQHADEPVLIHCKSGNRAGAMYGLYVGSVGSCSLDAAMDKARKAGLRQDSLADDLRRQLERRKRD